MRILVILILFSVSVLAQPYPGGQGPFPKPGGGGTTVTNLRAGNNMLITLDNGTNVVAMAGTVTNKTFQQATFIGSSDTNFLSVIAGDTGYSVSLRYAGTTNLDNVIGGGASALALFTNATKCALLDATNYIGNGPQWYLMPISSLADFNTIDYQTANNISVSGPWFSQDVLTGATNIFVTFGEPSIVVQGQAKIQGDLDVSGNITGNLPIATYTNNGLVASSNAAMVGTFGDVFRQDPYPLVMYDYCDFEELLSGAIASPLRSNGHPMYMMSDIGFWRFTNGLGVDTGGLSGTSIQRDANGIAMISSDRWPSGFAVNVDRLWTNGVAWMPWYDYSYFLHTFTPNVANVPIVVNDISNYCWIASTKGAPIAWRLDLGNPEFDRVLLPELRKSLVHIKTPVYIIAGAYGHVLATNSFYHAYADGIRIHPNEGDIVGQNSTLFNFFIQYETNALYQWVRPGRFQDVTAIEDTQTAQFATNMAVWTSIHHGHWDCLSGTPLIALNQDLLAIDRDQLAVAARIVLVTNGCYVYTGPLQNGSWSIALFNTNSTDKTFALNLADLVKWWALPSSGYVYDCLTNGYLSGTALSSWNVTVAKSNSLCFRLDTKLKAGPTGIKHYLATITQSGGSGVAPVVNLLDNTTGTTAVWTWDNTGRYKLTFGASILTAAKTAITTSTATVNTTSYLCYVNSGTVVFFESYQSGVATDGVAQPTKVEIFIYP